MNKDFEEINIALLSKFSEVVEISFKSNLFLNSFLDEELGLEEAKRIYDKYEEDSVPNVIEVGNHIVNNRSMIYLHDEKKLIYEDTYEEDTYEEIPFERIDSINRIIRIREKIEHSNGFISERFLQETSQLILSAKGSAQNLYNIKKAFSNCKVKVVDGVVYVTEPIVYVFLNLIKNKAKKFVIKINSSSYDKDAMKTFFSVYKNLRIITKDEGLASITPGTINVKKNIPYKNINFLQKRCELI